MVSDFFSVKEGGNPPPAGTHVPAKYATDTRREFDPETEVHHFGILVKLVDPGCTLEVQIEERSGQVTRITTTEDRTLDRAEIRKKVNDAVERMLNEWKI